jgi:hypothetical protein
MLWDYFTVNPRYSGLNGGEVIRIILQYGSMKKRIALKDKKKKKLRRQINGKYNNVSKK